MTNQSKKARWVDKLLYLMLVALLVVSGTFGITAARFFSSIKGEVTATTANPAIQLDYINMKGTEYLGDKSNYQVDEDIEVIEVQKGDILSEDDIIRYEDMYSRA